MGIFIGEHIFRFEPSTKTPGGTTFVQGEKFTGVLSWIINEGIVARAIGSREKAKGALRGTTGFEGMV
jgi:hypothetical protein